MIRFLFCFLRIMFDIMLDDFFAMFTHSELVLTHGVLYDRMGGDIYQGL